jgi:putative peptide zinc metalloprotease protein
MTTSGHALLSSNWYRLAELKPRLRGHAHIHRHVYRGQVWYVVEDRVSGKYHRFNPASYKVISLLDGRRNMQSVWLNIMANLANETPTQDEVIALLGQMYSADLIQCDVKPDMVEIFQRQGKQRRQLWMGRFANPMSMRFPLLDPNNFLDFLVGKFPFLGTRWGLMLWLVVVLPALLLIPAHWPDLTENFNEQLLSLDNLLLMGVVFPLVKVLHELGHAIACKLRGGEVHEMGLMILVFLPAPYVDASSASAFSSKWQRMLVGAAGMLTELFIAALAFYFWLLLAPGLARSLAYNVIVLASITTLFFNANPLLRYDGYYIFVDWLESPNFGSRSNKYWQYLMQHYLLGSKQAICPPSAPGEQTWFLCYEPLAFAYRLFVVFSMALLIAQQYFFLGVILALWGLVMSVGLPLFKGARFLLAGAGSMHLGSRAIMSVAGLVGGLLLFLWIIPLPLHTTAEGVLWPPEDAILRAEAGGFVTHLVVKSGENLSTGQIVLESIDPEIMAKRDAQSAKVEEIEAKYDAAWGVDPAKAMQLQDELHHERSALERILDELQHLTLRSHTIGKFLVQNPDDLPGRWLKKGDIVGYVQNNEVPTVRVVVFQDDVDRVRLATNQIEIKLPQNITQTWSAKVLREIPAANKELPSSSLGQQGGGEIQLDPHDEEGNQSLQALFEFELQIDKAINYRYLGTRVYVRFIHPAEPVGFRLWRAIRRLFLEQFLI